MIRREGRGRRGDGKQNGEEEEKVEDIKFRILGVVVFLLV